MSVSQSQNYFEIFGNFESFFLCHCKYCQKDSGSAHGANLFSTTAKLHWVSGEELVNSFILPNTAHKKSFCSNCGSAQPNIQMEGRLLVVPAGCLDSKLSMRPTAHIFVSSKAAWDTDLQSLKTIEGLPKQ